LPGSDIDLLRAAARQAGRIALRHFRKDPDSWDKGQDMGPVSVADLEIDTMLHADLLAARPDFGWLSEESEDAGDRLLHDTVFIVDPIDGTRSFLQGHENFAHSLAVSDRGKITAAVVYMPAKELMFEAVLGKGALLNGKPIRHSGETVLDGARMLVPGSQFRSDMWLSGPPPVERHFRSSLAYRLCLVAQGRFDGMFTLRDAWEWDIAAGDLICREAGAGVATRAGTETRYNNPKAQLPGILATAPVLLRPLLEHVASQLQTPNEARKQGRNLNQRT
jgi:myo-inositol-1(or 4)-monophosphatase